MVLAVIEEKTVSIQWLSKAGAPGVKSESLRRRFERFLADFCFKQSIVGKLILSLLPKPADGWVLAMDRTNWKFGKVHINILMVSVVLEGVGFPVAWLSLPKATKRGNSAKRHRIKVMEQVLEVMDVAEIKALTMDREFDGSGWLGWLELMEIPYVVRVKKSVMIGGRTAADMCLYKRWKKLEGMRQSVFGLAVFFAVKPISNAADPYLAVVSNRFAGSEALAIYNLRWGIENLFGHLKKRGFDFERTHLRKGDRIERLVAVLGVAFTLCHRWGKRIEETKGKKLKNHGYRARSLFRLGFESLHRIVKRPVYFVSDLMNFLRDVVFNCQKEIFVG